MDIHIVIFFTKTKFNLDKFYTDNIKSIIESAKQFNISNFHLYSPDNLPVSKYTLDYMNNTYNPGFGFYSWKPIIILDVMKKIKKGDVVLYHDGGRKEYEYGFRKDINKLVNKVIKEHNGVGVGIGEWPHHLLCKKECFIEMGCDESRYWNLKQVAANWSIWENNPLSLEILNEWKKWCFDPIGVIDDEYQNIQSEYPDFIGHRHDQAILTNIIYKYHFEGKGITPLTMNENRWEKDINFFISDN
jgi:hypothetical protein